MGICLLMKVEGCRQRFPWSALCHQQVQKDVDQQLWVCRVLAYALPSWELSRMGEHPKLGSWAMSQLTK